MRWQSDVTANRVLGVASPSDLNKAGPNKKDKPRINSNNPGPSGLRGPATRAGQASAASVDPSVEIYACEFPDCGREFDSKTGRGVHHRRAHPDWYDSRQTTVAAKARWTEEETLLVAKKEAELVQQGERFINQALAQSFPERTLESIKGKRKQPAYRDAVKRYLEPVPAEEDEGARCDVEHNDTDYRRVIADYLGSLPAPTSNKFSLNRLSNICSTLSSKTQTGILEDLTLYLRSVFPVKPRRAKLTGDVKTATLSRRQVRRSEYARTQDLWRKNRSKCLRMLLDDITGVQVPPKEIMVPFWETIMSGNISGSPGIEVVSPTIDGLWIPITALEIRKALPASTTSAGPDGLSAKSLRKVPVEVLERVLNLILWCGKAPTHLVESVTTLIPKKSNAHLPSDFRPITVSSVLLRTLHKILATRMARLIQLDQRQRAFRPTDGCSDNVFLLDLILRNHHRLHKPLFVASLDVAKAFDSVSHDTISETLEAMGIPPPMRSYIMDMYQRSTTVLSCNAWTSGSIKPTCGVKQGDPMSPIIFNMIMDRMLKKLPTDIGTRIGDTTINAAAFADDLLLFASTPVGLQKLLDQATEFLRKCGLKVNTSKCMTVSLRNVPHEKKTVVDRDTVFLCEGKALPALQRSDQWNYLGIPFTPEGRIKVDLSRKLLSALEKLSKAPLKPQQRLFGLRTMIIPGLFHQAVLGNINISVFRKCDRLVRCRVRQWLNLPSDVPNAYVHANVKDGGLGIASLRWSAPLQRLQRLEKLPLSDTMASCAPGLFLKSEIKRCNNRLLDNGLSISTSSALRKRWSQILYSKVDGVGLKESAKVPQQHIWVQDGTRFLSGHDYLQACKMRINALPTKSRTARGRPKDRQCRAGCYRAETLNHVIQQCHRTHGGRIKRHDAIVSYVCRSLEVKGYEVSVEPRLQTSVGLRKPDIVAKLGMTAVVIDAQIVNDQIDLDVAHSRKVNYYSEIEDDIKRKYNVRSVLCTSTTLSWRGLWSQASAEDMTSLGIVRKNQLKILSTRAIIGGLACFHIFNKSTQVAGRVG